MFVQAVCRAVAALNPVILNGNIVRKCINSKQIDSFWFSRAKCPADCDFPRFVSCFPAGEAACGKRFRRIGYGLQAVICGK